MNIQFECADKVNGLMTITIEQADYQAAVDKKLKEFRKKAQVPGFRPGMVPMGLIKKQYGTAIKYDEVNCVLGEKLYEYIHENKIQMLGEPMPNEEKQQPQDLQGDGPFEFFYDIAVAPEFTAELTAKDKIDYYDVQVDDKTIDDQVKMYQAQTGQFVEVQEWSGNDTLKGDLRQLDVDGNTLEGGITVEGASVMPSYVKGEDEKKKFDGCKPGDIVIFNPKKAYPDNDAEVAGLLKMKKEDIADLQSDFSFQVTEIRHFQPHDVDQELFDRIFGEGNVKDEADFRQKIANSIKPQLAANSDFKFLRDVRTYLEKKIGDVQFPEALLKRFMLKNNKDKGEDYVEKNFRGSIDELKWHLIKEQLVNANNIKVDDADLKQIARNAVRQQFAQYGMNDVPDDMVDSYADEQLKKRENVEGYVEHAIDMKLMQALKQVVKLNVKKVSIQDFNKLMQEA
ncbi:MAG: trigger factor [Prevotella sp.]|nr:trigger factor [Prevotella sp.]